VIAHIIISASPVAVSEPEEPTRHSRNTTKSPAASESAFVMVIDVSSRNPAVAGAVPVAVFAASNTLRVHVLCCRRW
jgi:hypothetical protein